MTVRFPEVVSLLLVRATVLGAVRKARGRRDVEPFVFVLVPALLVPGQFFSKPGSFPRQGMTFNPRRGSRDSSFPSLSVPPHPCSECPSPTSCDQASLHSARGASLDFRAAEIANHAGRLP